MKNIAITRSFASGKSFVLSYAKELGYKVFSCDDFIRDAYKDINLQNSVISQIKKLSKIIYDNSEAKKN